MKSFKQYITEMSNLAPSQLYKYSWRVEKFIEKFRLGQPIELVTGGNVVLKYDQKLETQITQKINPGKIVFAGKNGKTYSLSDFAKTKEFGGGGSGAGSDLTDLTESAQAVYAAAKWNGSKKYTDEDLKRAYAGADVSSSLANIIDKLTPEWRNSCILGAEILHKEFKGKGYTFHRGSSWVDGIETTFKNLNKKEKAFSNVNKWSPADIWMVSPKGASIKFKEATSIAELNGMLFDAIMSKDVIGVSLKLIKGTAKLSYYNIGQKKKSIKFEKFSTGTKGFFEGKDAYIFFSVDGKIQFRTFPETFQGEIKGKNANQGKLSYGPIQSILRGLKIKTLTDINVLRTQIKNKDTSFLEAFYTYYTKYSKDSPKLTYSTFIQACQDKGESWMFSKFLGVQLIEIISSSRKEDEFVNACVSYASSSSELSGPFAKVE